MKKIFFILLLLPLFVKSQVTNITGNKPKIVTVSTATSVATTDSFLLNIGGYLTTVSRANVISSLGTPVGTGGGANTRATFWNSATTITGISNFIMDSTTQNFHIFNSGAVSTGAGFTVNGTNDGSNVHMLHNDKFRLSINGTSNGSLGPINPQGSVLMAIKGSATLPIGVQIIPAADADLVFIVSNAANGANRVVFKGDGTALLAQGAGTVGIKATSPSALLHLGVGTTAASTAPLKFTTASAAVLTTPEAGVVEPDGNGVLYYTPETTAGRGYVPDVQRFRLTANGGTISTIANFFGSTSNPTLVSGAEYIIEIDCYFTNTTAGTVTWTFTNSAAPTSQNLHARFSPVSGIVAPEGSVAATYLEGDIQGDATAALALTTSATLTDATTQWAHFSFHLYNNTGTSFKIQATKLVGGTITPLKGSYWTCTRVPAGNTGIFVN